MTSPTLGGGLDSYEPTGEGLVHVRPIEPTDAEALICFHESLSRESQYFRFFTAHPHLTPKEVQRFTCVDGFDRLALIAESDGEILGIGRFDRLDDPQTAEVAFVVADAHQHQGIATTLLHRLADEAPKRGITTFVAETLGDNAKMQRVFRRSGFPVTTKFRDGVLEMRFPITGERE